MCRSVHAEANAIIAAPRELMLGATMYQSCVDPNSGKIVPEIDSCQMCKKLIINAGIEKVINRNTPTDYNTVIVADWVKDDDSLGKIGY